MRVSSRFNLAQLDVRHQLSESGPLSLWGKRLSARFTKSENAAVVQRLCGKWQPVHQGLVSGAAWHEQPLLAWPISNAPLWAGHPRFWLPHSIHTLDACKLAVGLLLKPSQVSLGPEQSCVEGNAVEL